MKRFLFGLVLAVAVLAAGSAQANSVIDFSTGDNSGGLLNLTSGTVYAGYYVPINLMQVFNTPDHSNPLGYDTTAYLNFNYDTAGGVNWMTVNGTVPQAGINTPNATLLAGVVSQFSVSQAPNGDITITLAGDNLLRPELAAWLGLSPETPWWFDGSTSGDFQYPGTWIATTTEMTDTAIPEPSSMLLLGTGLFGLAGAIRRRVKK